MPYINQVIVTWHRCHHRFSIWHRCGDRGNPWSTGTRWKLLVLAQSKVHMLFNVHAVSKQTLCSSRWRHSLVSPHTYRHVTRHRYISLSKMSTTCKAQLFANYSRKMPLSHMPLSFQTVWHWQLATWIQFWISNCCCIICPMHNKRRGTLNRGQACSAAQYRPK